MSDYENVGCGACGLPLIEDEGPECRRCASQVGSKEIVTLPGPGE